jgi:hypothetical protein
MSYVAGVGTCFYDNLRRGQGMQGTSVATVSLYNIFEIIFRDKFAILYISYTSRLFRNEIWNDNFEGPLRQFYCQAVLFC